MSTPPEALPYLIGEPFSAQLASDLGALECNVRYSGNRERNSQSLHFMISFEAEQHFTSSS